MPDHPVPQSEDEGVIAPAAEEENQLPPSRELDEMPRGVSVIHDRPHDAVEIWRLCCRLRLDMRDYGLKLEDALAVLQERYPDLEIGKKQLKLFMERYVDESPVVTPAFMRKGLMRSKAKMNAVAEASNVAQKMQDHFDKIAQKLARGDAKPEDIKMGKEMGEYGLKVIRARAIQFDMMDRIGMAGAAPKVPPQPQERQQDQVSPPIRIETQEAHFHLDGLGGSFARRHKRPVDAAVKGPVPSDAPA